MTLVPASCCGSTIRKSREWGVYACCDVVNLGVAAWKGASSRNSRWSPVALEQERENQTGPFKPRRRIVPTPLPARRGWSMARSSLVTGEASTASGLYHRLRRGDRRSGLALLYRARQPDDHRGRAPPGSHEFLAQRRMVEGRRRRYGLGLHGLRPRTQPSYIGVGNGAPWNRHIRSPGSGDNLYLSSIVAINPDGNGMVWHYQTTPGDNWITPLPST